MPRYRLDIEYDGRPYKGYQAQGDLPSVQSSLERGILAFSGETVRITAAGRTDTGVHALHQVVSFDLDTDFPAKTVMDAINALTRPEPIAVLQAVQADDEFSARFSARGREYIYRILNRRAPAALDQGRVWHVKKSLDIEAMQAAAVSLLGTHDFTTFRHVECQSKSPVKTLDFVEITQLGEKIHVEFKARSFLHRQVRSMVGTLVEVGLGRWSVARIGEALLACDRSACGQVAPPDGLYLSKVIYDTQSEDAK